jgi:hypothetical protein
LKKVYFIKELDVLGKPEGKTQLGALHVYGRGTIILKLVFNK